MQPFAGSARLALEELGVPHPPEVVFDRFFRSNELTRSDRETYRGKQDLTLLEPSVGSLLDNIQKALNGSLHQLQRRVFAQGQHPKLHFDYVASTVPNALAFTYEGDRKSTRLNSSHIQKSRMPSSA